MYEFRPIAERIQRLRAKTRDRMMVGDAVKSRLRFEARALYKNFPPIMAKPMETLYLIERMPIHIIEDEYFFGDFGNKGWGGADADRWLRADIENTWPIGEDGLHHAPDDDPEYSHQKLAISPEDLKELREITAEANHTFHNVRPLTYYPLGIDEMLKLQVETYGRPEGWAVLLPPGHLTPGYQHILRQGYGAIRKRAQDWLDAHKGNIMGDEAGKYLFYHACTAACDGAMTLTRRYAELAAKLAEEETRPEKKEEFAKMAEGLTWIIDKPARTFWEALQQYMLYHFFLRIDNGPGVTSMGRLDFRVWPYLKKELEEGTMTLEKAQELIDGYLLKMNIFWHGIFGETSKTGGIGNAYQHTTIGGVVPETGEDASNPVTYMVLEGIARLQLHEPTVSIRINKNTPDKLWECALETSRRVGGLPLIQNDEVIIPSIMREVGFTLEDARDFAFIGCQEITGSGNDYPCPNGIPMGHNGLWWSACLVTAINNGINPFVNQQAPPEYCSGYLYEMETYEDVKRAFEKLTKWLMTWSSSMNNYAEHEQYRLFPFPNLSISTEGCLESGKDVSEGGAKYNSYGGTATGLATVGDSLTAIKWAVYDKKICTGKQLLDALLANWEGAENEALRQKILHECPHYGNADPYADEEMKYVFDWYYNCSRGFTTKFCKVYKCGMFGAADHIPQGAKTWATPDGRKTGDPLADATSPAQGRDVNGPTAVFNSTLYWDNSRFMDGIALNMKIHPTALAKEGGIEKLRDMTKAYFDGGGVEVQYNVVDGETLRKAQANPDDYHNLVVRIAGFSAYFVDMTETMQNDIIRRAEHSV
ncbi:MAG: hypothetical protein IKG08_10630 [Eubacterium sp.]|nr:hypothetical protein [Eubacterium sp.]